MNFWNSPISIFYMLRFSEFYPIEKCSKSSLRPLKLGQRQSLRRNYLNTSQDLEGNFLGQEIGGSPNRKLRADPLANNID